MKAPLKHIEFDPLNLFGGGQTGKNLSKHRLLWKALCELEFDQWYPPASIAEVCATIDSRISLNTQQVRWFCSKFASQGVLEEEFDNTRIKSNGRIIKEGYRFKRRKQSEIL